MLNLPLLRRLFDVAEAARNAGVAPTESNLDSLVYLLQEAFHLSLDCRFKLWGSAPWSEDLRSHLASLLAYGYCAYATRPGDLEAHFVAGPAVASLLRFSEPLSMDQATKLAVALDSLSRSPHLPWPAVSTAAYFLLKGDCNPAEPLLTRMPNLSKQDAGLAIDIAAGILRAKQSTPLSWRLFSMPVIAH